ncbi:MAG: proline--tRNA ligase [Actinobacteria bacterium]|uniref:Proline--tRNA ligase n=1 Tax=freshwater metagenome TaxID=449393 RepID=A0A6J7FVA8_9ZZZZ|nr:proline--tRNA ligase [Actinomycetota bacterium]
MPTLLSQLFLRTLREDPADAEVTSHRLLLRAGYIRRQAPGIFAWLPLGLRVKAKVEKIVREEMAAAGAQEVHFPALLPKEPYQATGRWDEYGDGIFRLKDRKDADYLLAPTHEEAFTLLVKDLYTSYKDLPVCLYQIQDKYRDEARPRAGLLRGREFTMKDAYSFDVTDEGLAISYQAQRDAYERIFTRLGLDYVIVQADAGAMGGSRSEEFLHPTEVGEDSFVSTPAGYAANVEAFRTVAPPSEPIVGKPVVDLVSTPGATTIDGLVSLLNASFPRDAGAWHASDTLKNVVLALTHLDGTREVIVVGLPGDREVDLSRVEVALSPATVEPATDADFAKHKNLIRGYIGPWSEAGQLLGQQGSSKLRYFVDPRVVDGSAWVSGANTADTHAVNVVIGRDVIVDGVIECSDVRDGDPAPDGSGPVAITRGMEIGHVFQLGRKYAEALGLKVQDEDGKLVTVTMGSYGIGVTRILAVIAETNNDDKGIIWPANVSPFDVHVIATGKDDDVFAVAAQLSAELEARGREVLLDDRPKVSPGVKFGDAELIGIPTILIVGKGLADGVVEVWDRRTDQRTQVAVAEVIEYVTAG